MRRSAPLAVSWPAWAPPRRGGAAQPEAHSDSDDGRRSRLGHDNDGGAGEPQSSDSDSSDVERDHGSVTAGRAVVAVTMPLASRRSFELVQVAGATLSASRGESRCGVPLTRITLLAGSRGPDMGVHLHGCPSPRVVVPVPGPMEADRVAPAKSSLKRPAPSQESANVPADPPAGRVHDAAAASTQQKRARYENGIGERDQQSVSFAPSPPRVDGELVQLCNDGAAKEGSPASTFPVRAAAQYAVGSDAAVHLRAAKSRNIHVRYTPKHERQACVGLRYPPLKRRRMAGSRLTGVDPHATRWLAPSFGRATSGDESYGPGSPAPAGGRGGDSSSCSWPEGRRSADAARGNNGGGVRAPAERASFLDGIFDAYVAADVMMSLSSPDRARASSVRAPPPTASPAPCGPAPTEALDATELVPTAALIAEDVQPRMSCTLSERFRLLSSFSDPALVTETANGGCTLRFPDGSCNDMICAGRRLLVRTGAQRLPAEDARGALLNQIHTEH